ncbi:ATP-binding protein [Zoogloea oleivorans]|uniref:ATP-binding protein n=1 Tax=Zoogloea oleivorans TaxID=1552750 RepID=A0A6C2CCI3_9RHOO|nr:AAA family ATPase [Zoogloea oleivorans]TYC51153.1 ATP-binding protein [Zoogloea oleivorans]
MKIDHIYLKNYRCFAALSVDFHPQMTVLVAQNGQGKTTVLDAVKIALWPFVAGFDLGSTTNDVTSIHIDDVRREEVEAHEMDWRLPAEIKSSGNMHVRRLILEDVIEDPCPQAEEATRDFSIIYAENVPWQSVRYRDSVKKGTKTKDLVVVKALNLNETAKALELRIFSSSQSPPDDLPMLGYYGTGRLWAQKKLTAVHEKSDDETQSRTFAYRDCLDPASSYKHFAAWFSRVHKSYFQAQIRNLEKQLPLNADVAYGLIAPFKAVQKVVDCILKPHTGWHTLEYSAEHEELVLTNDQNGRLKVSQLSDGIRNMLALVSDIAYRCYKLNAHLGEAAPRRTHGIVMIDEVDMHLHPSWQQTVLTDLMAAFPKLQFIVTTHSPQVLTSVDCSCIRLLGQETDSETGEQVSTIKPVTLQTKGVASSDLLAQIMGVNPIPDLPEAQMVSDYHALIQQDLHETEGMALRERMEAHFGADHPVMRECERMIRLQTFKRRLPRKLGEGN